MFSVCRARRNTYLSYCCRTLATEASVQPVQTMVPPKTKGVKPVLSTAIILNRSPFLTRTPTSFERAYYAYQERLRRALSNPIPSDFYFQEGSILQTRFEMEERAREKLDFGPKFSKVDDLEKERLRLAKITLQQLGPQEGEEERLVSRVHGADKRKDYHSLDRKGRRNIYLLLKLANQTNWRFPEGSVEKGELLHQAAQRDLYAECGPHMDTWIVSKCPIGVHRPGSVDPKVPENITFFYKAHILAGQVKPSTGIDDFAWLTKQEIEERLSPQHWDSVRDILSDY